VFVGFPKTLFWGTKVVPDRMFPLGNPVGDSLLVWNVSSRFPKMILFGVCWDSGSLLFLLFGSRKNRFR